LRDTRCSKSSHRYGASWLSPRRRIVSPPQPREILTSDLVWPGFAASGRKLASRRFGRRPPAQTEPPKWPTETNEGIRANRPSNRQSLIRNPKARAAKTPRNRAFFQERLRFVASNLCSSHLSGGPEGMRTLDLVSRTRGESRSPNRTRRKVPTSARHPATEASKGERDMPESDSQRRVPAGGINWCPLIILTEFIDFI